MMKRSLIILTCLATAFLFTSINADENIEEQFETRYQTWKESESYSTAKVMSHAGPLFTCSEFKEITNLGLPALPYIVRKMERDSSEGYLWKAIEVIAKFKIYREYDRENKKVIFPDFPELELYDNLYLFWWQEGYKRTPQLFDELYSRWKQSKHANNEESEKIYQRMINLGIPVIPYMMREIEKGDSGLVPAVSYLTDGEISEETSPTECIRWWNENKEKWTIKFDDNELNDNKK